MLVVFKAEAQISVLKLADSLYATGNYSKAIEHYKKVDNAAEVQEQIAKSFLALGNYDAALSSYKSALEAHPQDVLLKFDYAKLLRSTKHNKESTALLRELVQTDDKNPNYHYELGVTLEHLNDSTAMNHYRLAFESDNTHQKAIYKIARQLLSKRKHQESLQFIKIGLDSYENNIELISLKAQNYYWMEDYRESAKWFEKLIELGESSQFIHESLGYCYMAHYNYKKAVEQGLLALEYDPKHFKNLFILGQAYEGLEDFPNAEKYMALALEIRDVPLDDEYTRLGKVLNRQEKYKEAIEVLQKALKINPNNDFAQFYLLMAKERYYGDLKVKLKLHEDFKTKYPKNPFIYWVDRHIKELKEEIFLNAED
ncbi:tetratricopeptide repeat protein [Subsaxibacter sp. CAU 1640]|uniref:tetratricopeptide repeat protein n=1 Tax=Subsaxibacter sp. CAU 1640 TaxID=2933271 RepID=UPI002004CCA1|nr:tetratricopeptide repeat protein [Subsaxibacter sp. CAU 1640]MCK7589124.1 tetratricopeptide repeat protein [Subsaxibacter sp. CAU 1640]